MQLARAPGKTNLVRAALLLSSALAAHPALAQESAQGGGIEDIVVTAQKREQNLQVVPISITALSPAAIQANRIQDVRDLNALAPNLTVRLSGGGGQIPNFTLRGLLTSGTAAGTDKGVAVYLDGVYMQNVVGSVFDFADIERIEVLKGPQGTLFGRNSTGGAISIVTRNPTGEFGVKQDLSYGNYDQFRSKTRVDLPRFGPFAASVTYLHSERRGDVRNLGAGTQFDYGPATGGQRGIRTSPRYLGGDNVEAVAVTVTADLIDDLDVSYKFDYSENNYTPNASGLVLLSPTVVAGGRTLPSVISQLYNASPNPRTPVTEKRPDAVNNAFTSNSRSWNYGHNLTTSFHLNDEITFKNILAYRKSFLRASYQLDGLGGLLNTPVDVRAVVAPLSPVAVNLAPGLLNASAGLRSGVANAPYIAAGNNTTLHEHQWSDEFQVNIETDWFNITAGYLFFYDRIRIGGDLTYFNSVSLAAIAGQQTSTPGVPFVFPGNPGFSPPDVRVTSNAWFVQPEIHITDKLDLVGGARITKDRKRGREYLPDQSRFGGTAANPVFNVVRYDDTEATFLAGVNYRPNSNMLIYAKYADGYISGGTLASIPFDPERAYSYEAGLKADLFDRRFRTNLAVFHVDYKAVQYTTAGILTGVASAAPFGQAVVSSADARANGFEWENTLVPFEGVTLTANVGYTDFKFDQDTVFGGFLPDGSVCKGQSCTGGFVSQSGLGQYREFQRPKWTGSLSAQYDSPAVISGGHLMARVDASFRSKTLMTSDLTNGSGLNLAEDPAIRRAATVPFTWLVNGRLGLVDLEFGRSKASVALWGKNIFNNRQITQFIGLDLGPFGYVASSIYERARTYGIDVSFSF